MNPSRGQLAQRIERKDDVRIGVGLGMIVVMMRDAQRRLSSVSPVDDAIRDVAGILGRKRLLIGTRRRRSRRRASRSAVERSLSNGVKGTQLRAMLSIEIKLLAMAAGPWTARRGERYCKSRRTSRICAFSGASAMSCTSM